MVYQSVGFDTFYCTEWKVWSNIEQADEKILSVVIIKKLDKDEPLNIKFIAYFVLLNYAEKDLLMRMAGGICTG